MTKLVKYIAELKKYVKEAKREGKTIGLVPTMGALHAGHISLIKAARAKADIVIVSVFVNPTQFGVNEDFSKYPRTLEKDFEVCKENGADFVFAPNSEEMYGVNETNKNRLSDNFLTYVTPPFSMVDVLCGKSRVGHFDGVALVVSKLFNISECDFAFFGQKDAQQLIILKKMVKDLNFPLEIIPCPIVRESSGLALSSRNSYLTAEGKQKATVLSKIVFMAKESFEKKGITDFNLIKDTAFSMLPADVELEYFDAVSSDTLEKTDTLKEGTLVAIAARVENVRLIDNVLL